jgi:hypothetical protein
MRLPGELALYSVIVVAVVLAGIWILVSTRKNPQEKERMRRLLVNRQGRMGDAMVTDASLDTVYYFYSLRGVEYHTSQDVSTLRDKLPGDPSTLIGPATLKYLPANPSNSILLCEEWSGFRRKSQSNFIQQGV